MQIIIPMSGSGQRFLDAGYNVPKALIEVDSKPIIGHVIDMFDVESDEFIFICSKTHLEETNMREILSRHCPNGLVIGIEPHKLGPVHAVRMAYSEIRDDEPAIINYCDFTCFWDYKHFQGWLKEVRPQGCIPAYRGFHPHSLGKTNYAFIKEEKGRILEIQEKQPFTDNKIEEFASSGTYYFSTGKSLKHYLEKAVNQKLSVNGEFYCSLPFNLMINDELDVRVYELQHFMQWGTPGDLHEYLGWSKVFSKLISGTERKVSKLENSTTLIPLAGRGSRFRSAGYKQIKPLLYVSGEEMVIQATRSLPYSESYHFVLLEETTSASNIAKRLKDEFPQCRIKTIEKVTNGQACTCLEAISSLGDDERFLTISACDHAVMYNSDALSTLLEVHDPDIVVWTASGHAGAIRNPEMYGWVNTDNGYVKNVSVKRSLGSPETDQLLIGTFTFKSKNVFEQAVTSMISRQGVINGEYYIDNAINDAVSMGYKCMVFEVDSYICWGTPNELRTFEYWQSCFHKWDSHPYSWELDSWKSDGAAIPAHLSKYLPGKLGSLEPLG